MTEDPRKIRHGPCLDVFTVQRCLYTGSVTKHMFPTKHTSHLASEQQAVLRERKNRQRPIDEGHELIITVDSLSLDLRYHAVVPWTLSHSFI